MQVCHHLRKFSYVINQEDYFWILDPIPEKTNPKCPIFKVYEYGIFFIFNKDGFTHFNELNSLVQTGNDNKTLVKKIGLEDLPTDVKNILLDTIPQYLQINYNISVPLKLGRSLI